MSSDFLEDVECDGSSVLLTMRASGFAQLTVLEPDTEDKEGRIASFPLTPNQLGLDNAEKIVTALKDWSNHIVKVGLVT